MRHVIIGNGVAGIEAALAVRARDRAADIAVVSRETEHFFARTALLYAATGALSAADLEPYERRTWTDLRIDLVCHEAARVDLLGKRLHLADGGTLAWDRLLLATGSRPARYGWPGQDLEGVATFVSWQDLERTVAALRHARQAGGRAVVIGGGLIGIELVEACLHHGLDVEFLVREPWYWQPVLSEAEGRFVERLLAGAGVTVRTSTELASIEGRAGRAAAVVTDRGETIPCDYVGLATGVTPETALAAAAGLPVGRGILADRTLCTPVPDVYAAGDCAEVELPGGNVRRSVWYGARDMGRVAGANMAGAGLTWDPGTWYNSAKFLDHEYTVAGRVYPLAAGEEEYFHQDDRHTVRVVHAGGRLLGVSCIGGRWDHTRLLAWIREGRDLDWFRAHLDQARFDPEFTRPAASRRGAKGIPA